MRRRDIVEQKKRLCCPLLEERLDLSKLKIHCITRRDKLSAAVSAVVLTHVAVLSSGNHVLIETDIVRPRVDMPLADSSRVVTLRLQALGQRLIRQVWTANLRIRRHHPTTRDALLWIKQYRRIVELPATSASILPRNHRRPGRHAQRIIGDAMGKACARFRHCIHVGRADDIVAVTTHFARAKLVTEDDLDVFFLTHRNRQTLGNG